MSELGELLEEFDPGDAFPLRVIEVDGIEEVTVSSILQPGAYALLRNGEVVYVGKAKVLLQRLYAHFNSMKRLREGKPALPGTKQVAFNGIRVYPCAITDIDALEQGLIRKHCPRYNEKHRPKPGTKMTLEQVGFDFARLGIATVVATPVFRRRV